MSMIQNMRQILEARSQAKKIQKQLAAQTCDYENAGVKVTVNGDMQIVALTMTDEAFADRARLERTLKENVNKALRMAKEQSAKAMAQELAGGGLAGLSGLFGGQG